MYSQTADNLLNSIFSELYKDNPAKVADYSFYDEDKGEIVVALSVPGLVRDSLEVKIDAKSLKVTGEYGFPEAESNRKFENLYYLRNVVDTSEASTGYDDGILRVRLPVAESNKPVTLKL